MEKASLVFQRSSQYCLKNINGNRSFYMFNLNTIKANHFVNQTLVPFVSTISSTARKPATITIVSTSSIPISQGYSSRNRSLLKNMSALSSFSSGETESQTIIENSVELLAIPDNYGGVTVNIEQPMDSQVFASRLRASMIEWRQQGKKGIWIKLPLANANLVEATVKEGFRYHHAESDYIMLVNWISDTPDTIPANTSHRVGIGAFVMNTNREVLVVKENSGPWKGKNVWKLPTGVANEGEDISEAAVREVKEETGIESKFVEVLAFRQSHKSYYQKSDLFFVCMLEPCSTDIQKQDSEIEAAQWMSIDEYTNQSFNRENVIFKNIAQICVKRSENVYSGFSHVPATTSSGKMIKMYYNTKDMDLL